MVKYLNSQVMNIQKLGSLIALFLVALTGPMVAQTQIDWKKLGDVKFEYQYDEALNQWFGKPEFGEEVKSLNGKNIQIKGYVLPVDVEGEYYALSAFPYVSCFFCGGAGPESVMELKLKDPDKKFTMDELLTFRGKLILNDKDFEMTYVLAEAEVVQ